MSKTHGLLILVVFYFRVESFIVDHRVIVIREKSQQKRMKTLQKKLVKVIFTDIRTACSMAHD